MGPSCSHSQEEEEEEEGTDGGNQGGVGARRPDSHPCPLKGQSSSGAPPARSGLTTYSSSALAPPQAGVEGGLPGGVTFQRRPGEAGLLSRFQEDGRPDRRLPGRLVSGEIRVDRTERRRDSVAFGTHFPHFSIGRKGRVRRRFAFQGTLERRTAHGLKAELNISICDGPNRRLVTLAVWAPVPGTPGPLVFLLKVERGRAGSRVLAACRLASALPPPADSESGVAAAGGLAAWCGDAVGLV
ncbi:unnamed protein product [Gadus morhua 'NCC']